MANQTLDTLTNDAKFLLASMYKEYVSRRKNDFSKENATKFNDIQNIHETLMPDWTIEDILFTCKELKRKVLISGTYYGEDNMILITISTEAIALMETTFKDKVDSVLEYLGKIKSAIPFV